VAAWESLIPAVTTHFTDVQPIDLATWISTLEAIKTPTEEDLQDKPALKILDFFNGILAGAEAESHPLETKKTQEASETMQKLKPIDVDIMNAWMRQWKF